MGAASRLASASVGTNAQAPAVRDEDWKRPALSETAATISLQSSLAEATSLSGARLDEAPRADRHPHGPAGARGERQAAMKASILARRHGRGGGANPRPCRNQNTVTGPGPVTAGSIFPGDCATAGRHGHPEEAPGSPYHSHAIGRGCRVWTAAAPAGPVSAMSAGPRTGRGGPGTVGPG
jgi:hypothetical protein